MAWFRRKTKDSPKTLDIVFYTYPKLLFAWPLIVLGYVLWFIDRSLGGVPPERKPTIIKSAVKIVGDHPAGAPLRGLDDLYRDLLKDEIRLRIAVDGSGSVSAGQVFAAVLTLRYTNVTTSPVEDLTVRISKCCELFSYQTASRAPETK